VCGAQQFACAEVVPVDVARSSALGSDLCRDRCWSDCTKSREP